jgi:hypothetical protein
VDVPKRASCHEAGHMAVALHFGREVNSAGLFEGRPKVDCFLEQPCSYVPRECFVFLTGGVAGELLCEPRTPFDSVGAQVDQQMITERGGKQIDEYLPDALKILRSYQKAWAALQYAFLLELRIAQAQNTIGANLGAGQSRTKTLLTGDRIKQIWDGSRT